jgi:peptidoglycan/xylan/chitin deacetylase (PgdA/CDA1 family)
MPRGSTIGLCFHGIGRPARPLEVDEDRYWVTEDEFLRILDVVPDLGPDVVLSFDDGNASDVRIALPALVDRGLTARFFVLAARLGRPGSLGSDEVLALAGAGMTVGTHGHSHVSWRTLDDTSAALELDDARRTIEEASGSPVREAACPFGEYDRRALARLASAGYDRVHTSDRMRSLPGSWLQPRYSVTASDTAETLKQTLAGSARPLARFERWAVTTAKRLR